MTDPIDHTGDPRPDRPRGERARRAGQQVRHLTLEMRADAHDRFGLLLTLLVAAFVLSAFTGRVAHAIAILINILMVLVAFRATGLRSLRRLWILAMVGLGGTAVARVIADTDLSVIVASWAQVLVLAAIFIATVARILRHRHVTIQTLLGAFSAYFLIGLTFSWLYLGLNRIGTPFFGAPVSESEFPYFSFITLTTVGYGDYAPVGEVNQRLVVVEALMGQIFLASLVARLVSLYGRPARRDPGDDGGTPAAPDPDDAGPVAP